MAEFAPRSALAHRRTSSGPARHAVGGLVISEASDIGVWLVTARTPFALPDAVTIAPGEYLAFSAPTLPAGGTALVQDMRAALAFIEVSGEGALDLLGMGPIAVDGEGAATTRLAGLRATILWRKTPQPWARIAVDRFSADYLWEWLCDRAAITG